MSNEVIYVNDGVDLAEVKGYNVLKNLENAFEEKKIKAENSRRETEIYNNEIKEMCNDMHNGYYKFNSGQAYFSFDEAKKGFKNIKNKINENVQINSNNIEVIKGGFNPILNAYAVQTNITYRKKVFYRGSQIRLINGEIKTSDLQVRDIISEKNYNGNPFLENAYAQEINANYIFNSKKKYKSNKLSSSLGIQKEKINYPMMNYLKGNMYRQAFLLDRDVLSELKYDSVNASEYINIAIDNKGIDMEIKKNQDLIYDGFLMSPKFNRTRDDLKAKLFVSDTNPVKWSAQTDAQFIQSMKNLTLLVQQIKAQNSDFDNGNDEVLISIGYDEYIKLLGMALTLDINNGTGTINLMGFGNCRTRLQMLLATGISAINAHYGLSTNNTLYDVDGILDNVYIYAKSYHSYSNAIDLGGIANGKLVRELDLKNDSNYTYTSPVDKGVLCLGIYSQVFYPSFKCKADFGEDNLLAFSV